MSVWPGYWTSEWEKGWDERFGELQKEWLRGLEELLSEWMKGWVGELSFTGNLSLNKNNIPQISASSLQQYLIKVTFSFCVLNAP